MSYYMGAVVRRFRTAYGLMRAPELMPLLMPLLLLVLLVLQPFTALAQEAVPALKGHVTDLTATLSAAQQAQLEQRLGAFEASKGTQLAVLMIPSTQPEAIEQYALRVAEQWKLGRKQVDDGAILLIAKNDRALRIEVGYGLEGALSDIVSKRIIEEHIRPRFQQGDFFGGIEAGLAQMMRVIDGEPLPSPRQQTGQAGQARQAGTRFEELRSMAPVLFIGVLAVGGVIARLLGKLPGALVTGGLVALIAWFVMGAVLVSLLAGLLAMVLTLLGVGRVLPGVGGWGGMGRGGGFRGGGLGGGFKGGGGGFGGGGASGRW